MCRFILSLWRGSRKALFLSGAAGIALGLAGVDGDKGTDVAAAKDKDGVAAAKDTSVVDCMFPSNFVLVVRSLSILVVIFS